MLLVREAGGMVSDPLGGEDYMQSGDVLAGSPKVHREMLPHLRRAALSLGVDNGTRSTQEV